MGAEVDLVLGLISSILTVLNAIAKVYSDAKDVESVPGEFREIPRQLAIVQATLQIAEKHIRTRLDEESSKTIKEPIQKCKDKALRLETILRKVIPHASARRLEYYRVARDALGKGYRVETLIEEILGDIKSLAENPAVSVATESQVEKLAKAIKEPSAIMPASLSEDARRNSMNNYGSGILNANFEKGTQNNNNASGKQFNAQTQYFGMQDYDSIR